MPETAITKEILVMAERVRLFYSGLLFPATGTLFLGASVFWLSSLNDTSGTDVWGVCLIAAGIVEIGLAVAWGRIKPADSDAWRWQYYVLLPLFLTGLSWGAIGVFPFPDYSSGVMQLYALTAISGVLLVVLLLSALELATLLFLLALILPIGYQFYAVGSTGNAPITSMLVGTFIGFCLVAAALSLLYGTIARLRAGKRNVSGKLDVAKERMEGLHSRLTNEDERRRDVEYELYLAKEEAETANMAKSEFLATMSHEIRTPLNGIVPLLEMLRETHLDGEQKQFVNTALTSSHHLLRIINDILDFSKIEAGKLEIEFIEFRLSEVVESVIVLLAKNADRRKLTLSHSIGPGVPEKIKSDPIRLRQVLTNLVSNAIKFTESGGMIRVEVNGRTDDGDSKEIVFAVRDTGVGMDRETTARLFRSFSQADASTTRKHGGTGLGLAICKRLVELMGGEIGVSSEKHKGSVFWFTLPLVRTSPQISMDTSTGSGANLRALLVAEISRDVKRIVKGLESFHFDYDQVEQPDNALLKLNSAANLGGVWSYRLVVVDARLLGGRLFNFISKIRASARFGDVKILVLSERESDGEFLANQGGVEVISHSARRDALYEYLARAAARPVEAPVAEQIDQNTEVRMSQVQEDLDRTWGQGFAEYQDELDAPTKPLKLLPDLIGKVLIVEDNPVNLAVARKLLQRVGIFCEIAKDGLDCLNMVEKNGYDLILMDCQMPRLDGYQATHAIREREQSLGLTRTPIIAMTANAMLGDREKCIDAGMDEYLAKPLLPDRLYRVMREWLPTKEMINGADLVYSDNEKGDDLLIEDDPSGLEQLLPNIDLAPSGGVEENQVIDQSVIEELYEIMEDDFIGLLDSYLENSPTLLAGIEAGVNSGHCSEVVIHAHSMKSSSANVGALKLSELSKQLEHAAREDDLAQVKRLTDQIVSEYTQVKRALSEICQHGINR